MQINRHFGRTAA